MVIESNCVQNRGLVSWYNVGTREIEASGSCAHGPDAVKQARTRHVCSTADRGASDASALLRAKPCKLARPATLAGMLARVGFDS
jgi:hypothetical protein